MNKYISNYYEYIINAPVTGRARIAENDGKK